MQVIGICEQLEQLKHEAAAVNQTRLVDDLGSQKLRLLQLSVRLHALSRVSPGIQRASVAAVVFCKMPADSAAACGHSCIAVRVCVCFTCNATSLWAYVLIRSSFLYPQPV